MRNALLTALFVVFVTGSALGQATTANCPAIEVVGPAGVTNLGEAMTFTARISAIGLKVTYQWTAENGTITEGQGTNVILVVGSEPGSTITATVKIDGLPSDCKNTASESAPLNFLVGCDAPWAEWGKLKPNEIRGQMDIFFANLSNNPNDKGLIIISVTENETQEPGNKRLQLLVRHAKFREFDLSRLVFKIERLDDQRTKLYRVPPGAEMPCSECIEYLGSSL